MIGAFTLCILFNQTVAIVFLAFISYLALKEYLSLIPTRRIDRVMLLFAYLAIPIQFYWAAIDWYGTFIVSGPVWTFLFFLVLTVPRPETKGSRARSACLSRGWTMTGSMARPTPRGRRRRAVRGSHRSPAGAGSWGGLFPLALTQFNDVAQYCWASA